MLKKIIAVVAVVAIGGAVIGLIRKKSEECGY